MKPITILTAPAAAGKNTIAHLYATQFADRCAVIDGDQVRWMLRQPHLAPWDEGGLEQHQLGVKHSALLARSFADEGFEVLILDVLWSDLAVRYRRDLAAYPLRIVRLLPSWAELLRRLHARPPSISDEEARWVHDTQAALTDFDFTLDNSAVSAEDAAAWIAAL